jgi:hypothetical protein
MSSDAYVPSAASCSRIKRSRPSSVWLFAWAIDATRWVDAFAYRMRPPFVECQSCGVDPVALQEALQKTTRSLEAPYASGEHDWIEPLFDLFWVNYSVGLPKPALSRTARWMAENKLRFENRPLMPDRSRIPNSLAKSLRHRNDGRLKCWL